MDRASLVSLLAREIVSRKQAGKPLKAGIDGRCAAGKSSLADELGQVLNARGLEVLRASVDGFHHPRERRYSQGDFSPQGYYDDSFNWEDIAGALLIPLSAAAFPVECRQIGFDIRSNQPLNVAPISVAANSVLLFDGIFIFRPEVNAYWDYRILVDIDWPTSLSRALIRDLEKVGTADVVRQKYTLRYEPAWQLYVNAEHPEAKADVIIDNRDLAHPRICSAP